MDKVKVEWHFDVFRELKDELLNRSLVSPLMWVHNLDFKNMNIEKVIDMMNFAPSNFDAFVCSLLVVLRGIVMQTATYENARAALLECRKMVADEHSPCELVAKYRRAAYHLIDTTFLFITCLHRRVSVTSVHANFPLWMDRIENVGVLTRAEQSALSAAKSLTLQLCHYGLPQPLMDEQGPIFQSAVQSARLANFLHPEEGSWITLYARCLPWQDKDKAHLLSLGATQSFTPFTVVEFASYLARSTNTAAIDTAGKLIEKAVTQWPSCVYVLSSYINLFLESNCSNKLRFETAEECLRRAQKLAPDSLMLQEYAERLLEGKVRLCAIYEDSDSEPVVNGNLPQEPPQPAPLIAANGPAPSFSDEMCRSATEATSVERREGPARGTDSLWSPVKKAPRALHAKVEQAAFVDRQTTSTGPPVALDKPRTQVKLNLPRRPLLSQSAGSPSNPSVSPSPPPTLAPVPSPSVLVSSAPPCNSSTAPSGTSKCASASSIASTYVASSSSTTALTSPSSTSSSITPPSSASRSLSPCSRAASSTLSCSAPPFIPSNSVRLVSTPPSELHAPRPSSRWAKWRGHSQPSSVEPPSTESSVSKVPSSSFPPASPPLTTELPPAVSSESLPTKTITSTTSTNDRVNCVCSGDCALATFRNFNTLHPTPFYRKVCLRAT